MNAFRTWLRVCQLALLTVVILGVASRGLAMQGLPPQIGVLVTCFSADTEQVDPLLSQHRRDGDDAALRTAVQGLVEAGKAELKEIAYGSTRSGFPMKVESVVERLYPTENDPAEIPQELRGPIQAATRLTSHATPTAFQSRPTGLTLQVTPQGGPHGRLIELDFNLDGSEHVNDDVHSRGEAEVRMPVFDAHQVTQKLLMESGVEVLAATLSPPSSSNPKRILVFVRATFLPPIPIEDWRERREALLLEAEEHLAEITSDPFADPCGGDKSESGPLPDPSGRMVLTTLEVVDLPQAHVFRLMGDRMTTSNATAMRGEIEQLIRSGEAVLTHSSLISSRPGVPARGRSGPERIYPVEFDPPEMPQKVEGPLESGVSIITPAHPTTFETRTEGLLFGVDLQVAPSNDLIEFSLAPEVVSRVGFAEHGKGEAKVRMPLFETRRVMTNAMVLDGKPILLSVHSRRMPEGKNTGTYSMMFLTGVIKKIPAEADAAPEANP